MTMRASSDYHDFELVDVVMCKVLLTLANRAGFVAKVCQVRVVEPAPLSKQQPLGRTEVTVDTQVPH